MTRGIVGEEGQRCGLRSRRDDAVVKRHRAVGHGDRVGPAEAGRRRGSPRPCAAWRGGQPAGELARRPTASTTAAPPRRCVGSPNADAVRGHLLGLGDDAGGVQERLGGDAADVQAHAAQRLVALDQHRLQPEVGGAKRRRVAARSGADDEHLRVVITGIRSRAVRRPGLRCIRAEGGGGGGDRGVGAAAAARSPSPSSVSSTLPSDTRSPSFTRSCVTCRRTGRGRPSWPCRTRA